MLQIDWEDYDENTRITIDAKVRELVAYDDFYWTIHIESSIQSEERLGGEGINGVIMTSLLCDVWFRLCNEEAVHMDTLYRALHLVVCDCHNVKRENFIHKYKDLYDFYISMEEELAHEINSGVDHVEWDILVKSCMCCTIPVILRIDMRGDCFS